ncbi:universal stress protein [Kitasatospora sp. NPDC059571]|uniref:universal stress protein n=1 Tax=Kitasatospora sp. NPDC059571 TaxID=3346871 RepID=UPI0036B63ACD
MSQPVVVGIDASDPAGSALDWASDEAQLRGVPLHVVHAWPGEAAVAPDGREPTAIREIGEDLLDGARRRALLRHPGLSVTAALLDDDPRAALTDAAGSAALLVVGARGTGGFPRLLLGSTGLHAAATAPCPVVVVRPSEGASGGIAVGVVGDGHDDAVLELAFEAARRRRAPLLAVHSWTYPLISTGGGRPPVYEKGHIAAEHERLLSEVLSGWRESHPEVSVSAVSVRSGAAKELVSRSKAQQLLVVGRRGEPKGPFGRLGSTSQTVVQHAECPVAVVPLPA